MVEKAVKNFEQWMIINLIIFVFLPWSVYQSNR